MKRIVSEAILSFLLLSLITSTIKVEPVKATGTIYIRPDGRVDPSTAPIKREGDVYTFTGNISDSIVVEKDNVVLDGAGLTMQPGPGGGMGVDLSLQSNITVKNIKMTGFYAGIYLVYSDNNKILNNTITNSNFGIYLWYASNNNKIFDNTVSANGWYGIELDHSSNNNTVTRNNIVGNPYGIYQDHLSTNNKVSGNVIFNNSVGTMFMRSSSNNTLHHNNFIANSINVVCDESSTNRWDDGYPAAGNYWSDYSGADSYRNQYQNESGRDGVGDTPYIIDVENKDNYPLMKPYVQGNLTIEVYTDKYRYSEGNIMNLGLNVRNPDSVKHVCFAAWVELPNDTYASIQPIILYMHEHSVVLPFGLDIDNPSFGIFTLPTLTPGIYVWHTAFLERTTHMTIVEDTAEWQFG